LLLLLLGQDNSVSLKHPQQLLRFSGCVAWGWSKVQDL
jgi:hypothetical protein